ncbi:MAG: hypothetical protein ACRCX2_38760 [Paraclostridium sp.]
MRRNKEKGCMPCKIKAFFAKFKKSKNKAKTMQAKSDCSWWMWWC